MSLFIDADLVQVEAAVRAGAPAIEIHTGHYADAENQAACLQELQRIKAAVEHGVKSGLQVNAGHGLNYQNVGAVAAIANIRELNIGHAIIARALFTGLQESVREMKRLMTEARRA